MGYGRLTGTAERAVFSTGIMDLTADTCHALAVITVPAVTVLSWAASYTTSEIIEMRVVNFIPLTETMHLGDSADIFKIRQEDFQCPAVILEDKLDRDTVPDEDAACLTLDDLKPGHLACIHAHPFCASGRTRTPEAEATGLQPAPFATRVTLA